jgi:hypothetical protein
VKFTLTIELGNDAMRTGNDLGRAVSDVGHKLVTGFDGIDLSDPDGNGAGGVIKSVVSP